MNNFVEKICSLDCIHQWEERDSVIKESVSQHSFKVAAITFYLLQKAKDGLNNEVNKTVLHEQLEAFSQYAHQCVEYALLHDFDEAILGRDISHVVKYNKYNGSEIRNVLDDFVNQHMKDEFPEIDLHPTYNVKRLVKLADWICLSIFIRRNKAMGCSTFEKEGEYCKGNIETVCADCETILQEQYSITPGILTTIVQQLTM